VRKSEAKGTMIKVKKAYDISPPSKRHMVVYDALKNLRNVEPGNETQVTLLELGFLTGVTPGLLKNSINWLDYRRYIKKLEIDEAKGTLNFYFTNIRPDFNDVKDQSDSAKD
jgi:hypothetical protein